MPQPVALIEDRISTHYAQLSTKLRVAADYVAANPVDVATRSLRSVAQTSGVSPATFSRLARTLGFSDYEEMREAGRAAVGEKLIPFSERAQTAQAKGRAQKVADLIHEQLRAAQTNLTYLDQNISVGQLDAAADTLHKAGTVLLVGSKGSAGLVDYFSYQAQWLKDSWHVAGSGGKSIATAMIRMKPGDALLVLSKTPYAARSVRALREAKARGITTIVITDSHASPALEFADHRFTVPTESPNFFSSYVAALALLETLMLLLLTRAGPEAESRIRETEDQVRRLEENWSA